jgi:hypothetical protein
MLYEQFKYNLGIMAEHFANLLAVGISGIGLDYKKHYLYMNFTTEIGLPSTIICTLYSQGLQCKFELRLSSLTVVKRTFCLQCACSE